jgi:nitroimidazol reductase NimA-like FMN-containing flavoprotein (pyridoxamine 5'-phosphate oxidase superfamily)
MEKEIRKKILALLDEHRIMTIATLRPDGWPQATTIGYVNEGLSTSCVGSTAGRRRTSRATIAFR